MKKLLVLTLATVFAISLNAQDIKVGAKVGYGMSGYILNFDKPDGSKMANGFNFGIVGEIDMGGVGGRLDVSYIQLGSDFYNDGELGGVSFLSDLKTDVTYLQVGVAAKKSIGPAYAYAGPYLAYALSNVTNGEITVNGETGELEDIDNYKNLIDGSDRDFYNKIDYGLYGGAGIEIKGIFVEVYAGVGLMNFMNADSDEYQSNTDRAIDINDDPDVEIGGFRYSDGNVAVEEPTQNNLFFGFSVGYLFGF